jgi:aryl-alcohol dehydrogenase-like predicted oxidoreductase
MEGRRLGNVGIKLSGVSYSAAGLSATGWDPVSKALKLGVNYIDSSPTYGASEEILGKNLLGWRDRVYLSTRWFTDGTASADSLVESFEESMHRLKTNYIDIIISDNVINPAQLQCIGSLEAFNRLKREKRVGYRGFAIHCCMPELLKAVFMLGGYDVIMVDYNIFSYRDLRDIVESLSRRGVGIIATNVIEASNSNPSLAKRLVGKREKSIAKASIKWALGENGISTVLCPMKTPEEAEEYIQAVLEFEED